MRNLMRCSWMWLVVICGLAGVVYGAAGLRVSGNGRYIETTGGVPFLYLQDTDWLLNRHPDAQITTLLNDRAAKGFTVIKIGMQGLNSGYQDYSAPTKDFNGNYPFNSNSVTQLNAGWWDRLVWIADQCAAKGLYLELTIGGPGRKETGKPYCQSNEQCYEYGRQVGLKFNNKTNIIFNIGQDMRASDGVGVTGWRAIAEGVADGVNGANSYNQAADYSTTFMLFHPDGHSPYSSSASFAADSWLDAHSIEVYHDNTKIYDAVTADYNRTSPVKPVVMLEGSYEDDIMDIPGLTDPHYMRVEAWHSYFAGGFYGYGHFNNYNQTSVNYSTTCNVNYINSNGSKQMGYAATFLKAREWWKLVPDQGIISSGVGSGATRLAAVKSTDGDECYIYFPTRSAASIVMNRITTGSSVSAVWFDPRNQSTQPAGTFASSTTQSLTPPAGWEDAVLCLNAENVNTVALPAISPNGGSYTGSVSVTMTCATNDAEIRYTTNGSDPTASSTLYGGAFNVTAPVTIKAIGVKTGMTSSAVATVAFTPAALAPLMFEDNFNDGNTNAGTVEGWYPNVAGFYTVVNGELKATGTTTANMQAYASFVPKADFYSLEAKIIATATVGSSQGIAIFKGAYEQGNQNSITFGIDNNNTLSYGIGINSVFQGAHTIPGAVDRTQWHVYKIAIQEDGTFSLYLDGDLKASGINVGPASKWVGGFGPVGDGALFTTCTQAGQVLNTRFDDVKVYGRGSAVEVVSTPTISPNGGNFSDSVMVSLTCATSGATIRYTTNSSDPTSSSTQYSAPFKLTANTTVKAKAFKTGATESGIASASFTKIVVQPPQLVGHWQLDGNLNDASTNAHHGTLVGAPTYVSGKSGQAINLNGSTDAVSISGLDAYKSPLVTVAAWVKLTMTDVVAGDVVSMGDSYALRISSAGDVEFFIYDGTTWLYPSAAGVNIKDGVWHHIVGQKTFSGLAVYVDGVLRGSSSATNSIVYSLGSNLVIGKHGNGAADYDFNGAIDDVRLYNYALSDAEIRTLAGPAGITPPVFGRPMHAAFGHANPLRRTELLGLMKNNGLRVYNLSGSVVRAADIQEQGLYIIGTESQEMARKIMVIK